MAKAEVTQLPTAAEPAQPAKRRAPLTPDRVKLQESVNNRHRAIVPRGTSRRDLLLPDMWKVVAGKFTQYDIVHVIDEAGTFFAELLVNDVGLGRCQMVELRHVELPRIVDADSDVPSNHLIDWNGPEDGWTIVRISDSVTIGKNFPSRPEALAFLLEHASLR